MPIKTIHLHESKTLASNADSTIQIPLYGTIHNLMLRFTNSSGAACTEAQIRAEVGKIRLSFDGKDKINLTAAELYDIYETIGNNVAVNAGVAGDLELNLGRLLMNNPAARDLLGFGSSDLTVMQVTVTAGSLTNVANVQAITTRTKDVKPLGAHTTCLSYPQSFNATGEHTVDTLPRDSSSAYAAVLVKAGASGVISTSEVRVNNETIVEKLPIDTNQLILSSNNLVQPSGYFVHGFNDGQEGSILPMNGVNEFRVITNFTTAPGAGGYSILPITVQYGK